MKLRLVLFSMFATMFNSQTVFAQSFDISTVASPSAALNSLGATGDSYRRSSNTGQQSQTISRTQKPNLPNCSLSTLAGRFGQMASNGLPICRMDSFVLEAGSKAELIYGDEGEDGVSPIEGFNKENRINTGIMGNDAGLTTGHKSALPSAWGRDEFIGGPE